MKPITPLVVIPIIWLALSLFATADITSDKITFFAHPNHDFQQANSLVWGIAFVFAFALYFFNRRTENKSEITRKQKEDDEYKRKEQEAKQEQLFQGVWLQFYKDISFLVKEHNEYHTIATYLKKWKIDNHPQRTPKISVPVLARILKLTHSLSADSFLDYLTTKIPQSDTIKFDAELKQKAQDLVAKQVLTLEDLQEFATALTNYHKSSVAIEAIIRDYEGASSDGQRLVRPWVAPFSETTKLKETMQRYAQYLVKQTILHLLNKPVITAQQNSVLT